VEIFKSKNDAMFTTSTPHLNATLKKIPFIFSTKSEIEFQLTLLINTASVDNLFITELCQWFKSQFSNSCVCHRTSRAQKKIEIEIIKPSRTEKFDDFYVEKNINI
jgi:hypothetical protein